MIARDFILDTLLNEVVKVSFTKANGEARDMLCTLREDLLPKTESKGSKKKNEEAVAVYDLEKKDWRSFRVDSINTFEVTKKYG